MKRMKLLGIGSLLIAGVALAGTLTLVKPNGGENWELGSDKVIQWTADGVGTLVKLVLFQNGAKVGNIKQNLNATPGSYLWKVGSFEGGTAPAGGGFHVRIIAMDGSVKDDSDGMFSISPKLTIGQPGIGGTVAILGQGLSGVSQQSMLNQITRIDRIEPVPFTSDYGIYVPGRVIGQGFGVSQGDRPQNMIMLVAESKLNHVMFTMRIDEWHEGLILFKRPGDMPNGDYLVYLVNYVMQPVSNKVDLRIGNNKPEIVAVSPNWAPVSASRIQVILQGIYFNQAYDSRVAQLQMSGRYTNLDIDMWTDTLIKGKLMVPALPGNYEMVIVIVKNGRETWSNPVPFEVK